MMRRSETRIHVAAAGLAAAGTLSATVRVPPFGQPGKGHHQATCQPCPLRQSEVCRKAGEDLRRGSERLADAIGSELLEVIGRAATGVKLVTDVPLEWLPMGNLPLSLCKDVARITTTPGNLQIELLSRSELLHLAVEAFHEVLVVTAFDPKDPIANVLAQMLASWQEAYEGRLAIRIVQVQSRSEFIDVLNSFGGAVMIFDGHGHHDRTTGQARSGWARRRSPSGTCAHGAFPANRDPERVRHTGGGPSHATTANGSQRRRHHRGRKSASAQSARCSAAYRPPDLAAR